VNARQQKPITKGIAFSILLGSSLALADGKAVPVDIHAETPVVAVCGTVQAFAGEALVLDSSRAHVDDATKGRGIPCEGWVSVQTGWLEFKHREGHVVRVGENSFLQVTALPETLTLLRGVAQVRSFDDGADLRAVTPNARVRMKQGAGILVYRPDQQRTQWVSLERLAILENRFEPESHVSVAGGESSILDLTRPRVLPSLPKAITIASLKPILKQLDVSEKFAASAIQTALERQRRVLPSVITGVGKSEMRGPASVRDSKEAYHRHAPQHHDIKAEKHLAKKWSGGAPVSLLEPELLEKKLQAKAAAKEQSEKRRLFRELEELERKPASERE